MSYLVRSARNLQNSLVSMFSNLSNNQETMRYVNENICSQNRTNLPNFEKPTLNSLFSQTPLTQSEKENRHTQEITYRPITDINFVNRMLEIQEKAQKKLDSAGNSAFIYKQKPQFFENAITSLEKEVVGAFIRENGEDILVGYIIVDNNNVRNHIDPNLLPEFLREDVDRMNYSGTMLSDPDYSNRIKGIGAELVREANEVSRTRNRNFTASLISAGNFPSITSSTKNSGYIARAFVDPEDNTDTYLMIRDLRNRILINNANNIRYIEVSERVDKQESALLYNTINRTNAEDPNIIHKLNIRSNQLKKAIEDNNFNIGYSNQMTIWE